MVFSLRDEDEVVEKILKAISGSKEYSEKEVLRIALREAARDQLGVWGRVWVSDLEKIVGRSIDAVKLVEALKDMGYKVKYIDVSGGIIYISL